MTIKKLGSKLLILLFFVCILTRIISSIFYIEDIDSLRFALSLYEFNIVELQPHFPGYPIFVALAKAFYSIINNMGGTFSLIGGISLFILIVFTLKLFGISPHSSFGLLTTIIILLNPFIWIMSNRYMPDLMGVSVSVASMYFLTIKPKRLNFLLIGFFLAGILCGTRLSYLPILLILLIFHTVKNNERHKLFFSFSIGCVLWLIPMILMTGFENLYLAALKQTAGHFNDFGGTIVTEGTWHRRISNMIRSIWADGLGGFWLGRSWHTLFISLIMGYFYYHAFMIVKNKKFNQQYLLILGSIAFYGLWIFFFQNIIYKSRHILPLISFLIVFLNLGIKRLRNENKLLGNILVGLYLISLCNVTYVLTSQHKKPNAISSVKDYIIKQDINYSIVSIPLINFYLKSHGLKNEFFDIEDITNSEPVKALTRDSLLIVGNFQNKFSDDYINTYDTTFYHNPYVNRMWSELGIFNLKKK